MALILCCSLASPAFAAVAESEGEEATAPQTETVVSTDSEDWLVICIDPGHGGKDSGAVAKYNGKEYHEADLVLKIALYLKEELEKYEKVVVVMTREDENGDPSIIKSKEIVPRVEFAAEHNADFLISLHLNASENLNMHGALMLDSNGNYNKETAEIGNGVGANILSALSNLGLLNRGHLHRNSQDYKNPDGSAADYYGIVRGGIWRNIPSIIVEHCFLTNEDDFNGFLNSDKKLQQLAKADADGIAAYYGLEEKDETDTQNPIILLDCDGHWAKKNIDAAVTKGWIFGYPDHTFKPNNTLTRADFVTMLARVSGEELPEVQESPFSDFSADTYYARSVQWAVDAGIIKGFEDGTFHPGQSITREQMAHIMAMYLAHKGYEVKPESDKTQDKIEDYSSISGYAKEDVCFCYEEGLLTGRGNGFVPADGATRAEACTVLLRLDTYVADHPLPETPEESPEPDESPKPEETTKPASTPKSEDTAKDTASPKPEKSAKADAVEDVEASTEQKPDIVPAESTPADKDAAPSESTASAPAEETVESESTPDEQEAPAPAQSEAAEPGEITEPEA